jgi:transcriptional regulator with XRE-family HTH domain
MPRRKGEPDPVDVEVGRRIRERRRELGVSQMTLAGAVGVTFQQVQKYERGLNRASASMLAKLAKALDLTIADFFGGQAPSPADSEVVKLLSVPDSQALLIAYSKIAAPEARRVLLQMTRAMAGLADKLVPDEPA